MAQERGKFVAGAKKLHDIDEAVSDAIFDILNKFAGYGFNKSHSAAYAIISYQTGYLKANHPVQFMAAVLSSELGNAEKVSHFIDEAMAMGIPVLGPDVNESREMFTPVVQRSSRVGGRESRARSRRTPLRRRGPRPSTLDPAGSSDEAPDPRPSLSTSPRGRPPPSASGSPGSRAWASRPPSASWPSARRAGPIRDFQDFLLRSDARGDQQARG